MKNILLILLFALTFYSCKAQTIYPLGTPPEQIEGDNYYVKDTQNVYDSIVGTWYWEDGNTSFELILQKLEQNPSTVGSTQYRDVVFGRYKYIENGVTIAEVTEIPDLLENGPKVYVGYRTSTTFWIQLTDIVSKEYKQGNFTLNTDGSVTITLEDPIGTSGVRTPNDPPPSTLGFQLPTNITLTKVE